MNRLFIIISRNFFYHCLFPLIFAHKHTRIDCHQRYIFNKIVDRVNTIIYGMRIPFVYESMKKEKATGRIFEESLTMEAVSSIPPPPPLLYPPMLWRCNNVRIASLCWKSKISSYIFMHLQRGIWVIARLIFHRDRALDAWREYAVYFIWLWQSAAKARASLIINRLDTHSSGYIIAFSRNENRKTSTTNNEFWTTTPYMSNAFYQQTISRASCLSAQPALFYVWVSECIFIPLLRHKT